MSGAVGSNECPAGSVRIETAAECRTAAAAAGKTVASYFVEDRAYYPRGCHYNTGGTLAYFNAHAVGAGHSGAQLLCATTGVPLAPPKRTRRGRRLGPCVRVCVRVCV